MRYHIPGYVHIYQRFISRCNVLNRGGACEMLGRGTCQRIQPRHTAVWKDTHDNISTAKQAAIMRFGTNVIDVTTFFAPMSIIAKIHATNDLPL